MTDAAMKLYRRLQEADATVFTDTNDSEVMRNTLSVYGTALVMIFIVFCYARIYFPRPYTIRKWSDKYKTKLAEKQFGIFSWMWMMNDFYDDDIMDECGMDSLCFLRLCRMGCKIAILGMVNAIWLMPIYKTSKETEETDYDGLVQVTIGYVPSKSPRLIATVIAAYLLFFYMFNLILKEFRWFIQQRHRFLQRQRPGNYSVYVRNIPAEYRTNQALEKFFRQSLGSQCQPEAHIRVMVPELAKVVKAREQTLEKLNHAIEYENMNGVAPTHTEGLASVVVGGPQVDSIQAYTEELRQQNEDITRRIETIEAASFREKQPQSTSHLSVPSSNSPEGEQTDDPLFSATDQSEDRNSPFGFNDQTEDNTNNTFQTFETSNEEAESTPKRHSKNFLVNTVSNVASKATTAANMGVSVVASGVKGGANNGVRLVSTGAKAMAADVKSLANDFKHAATDATSAAAHMTSLFIGGGEGEQYSAGFCSFSSLSHASAARQMVHNSEPFTMEVREAPEPDDVFWANVGREHSDLQAGKLTSLAATVALCLFWTIPISFFASLSSVEKLREEVDFLDKWIDEAPWLGPLLVQLAPLFVVVLNYLLPVILEWLSMFEGPVSGSVVQASLFSKLAAFMIIQTFFVSAISGTLLKEISNMLKDTSAIIDLLANSLPNQSTYFMQIVFVRTTITVGMEILRVVPIALAFVRKFVGPRLSERERQTKYLFFRPLAEPPEAQNAENFSQLVFYFVVMLVYQTIAPLTSFIMWFVFGFVYVVYRHQFVYIYPKLPDSGGRVWTKFISLLLSVMLIAQFTILGLMALKKATIATPMMIPLIVITILFSAYVRHEHFRVAECLPSRDSIMADLAYGNDVDLSFVKSAYVQPELQDKELQPEVQRNNLRSAYDAL